MQTKLDRYINFVPNELKPASNPILNALLRAWAGEDEEILTQLKNTEAQLFVKTAEGNYLDRQASNYGVSRPSALGLLDEDFQKLIPNLSLKQKQITKSFYDTMDVFWGPQFSRANVTSTLSEPYAINMGDVFELKVDGAAAVRTNVLPGDIRLPGAATVAEVQRILSRISLITVDVIEEPTSGLKSLNIRTNTPGPRGNIEFLDGFAALGIVQNNKYKVSDLAQRTVLYQITPGEILIELPATVPTLRRTLKGSHHFHADSILESAIPPGNGIWAGSFVYSTNEFPYVVTSIKATLQDNVLKGSVVNQITVDDSSAFPATGGKLVFDFGKGTQELPVDYITVPNNNTILIDPGYSFSQDHLAGATVNYLLPGQTTPYAPRRNGSDLAVYLTSPANARDVVQEILKSLAVAGVVVTFLVLLPSYKYIIDNPYGI